MSTSNEELFWVFQLLFRPKRFIKARHSSRWLLVRFTRGMLFLPERHIHCFSGSFKQPGLIRSINIFREHNDLLHLLLTFKQQLQEDSHFADPLLKLVYETALLKERILKRLVVLSVS